MSEYIITAVVFVIFLILIKYTIGFKFFLQFLPVIVVNSKEAVVVDNRLGKDRILLEGFRWVMPIRDVVVKKVSLKEITIDPPEQEIVTKDNISIGIDMIASIKIVDVLKAVMDIDDYMKSTTNLVETAALNIMGSMDLIDIQKNIDKISKEIKEKMKEDTSRWGLEVLQVHIENVKLPDSIKLSMEKEIEAEKDSKAKLLRAEADKKALIKKAEGKKIAAEYEAEALRHEIDIIKESMPDMDDNKILEFLTSVSYIHSMKNLSSSDNAKVVVYPADIQKSINGFMAMPGLTGDIDSKDKCDN